MLPVKPVICELETWGPVRGSYDSVTATTLLILVMSSFSINRVKVTILPPFHPNSYMLATYRSTSPDDWKIYATCVKQVMRKQSSGLKDDTTSLREKLLYEDFMNLYTHDVTIDGVTYAGREMRPEEESFLKA